jgi:arsenite methyltransferase
MLEDFGTGKGFRCRGKEVNRIEAFSDLSSWALHNIYDPAGRRLALEEIVRILKPGGRVLITDIRHAHEYSEVFRSLSLNNVNVSAPTFIFVIPSRCVSARKPKAEFST